MTILHIPTKSKKWTIQFWTSIEFKDPVTGNEVIAEWTWKTGTLTYNEYNTADVKWYDDIIDIYNDQQHLIDLLTHQGVLMTLKDIQEVSV